MPIAADIMTKEIISVNPETTLKELAEIFMKKQINGMPVLDNEGNILGVVCESDLVNQDKPLHIPTVFAILDAFIPIGNPFALDKEIKRITATKVQDIYSRPAVCVQPETDVSEVARIMADKRLYTIPVVQSGRLVGVIGKRDIIKSVLL